MSAPVPHDGAGSGVALDLATYQALLRLYAEYAYAVDSGHWDLWPDFFVEECLYRLVPRENHERGLPLATLAFESKAMLRDRVYGIRETLFHDPYYQRHVVGPPLVRASSPGRLESEANYAVFRTKLDGPTTVFNVGRTIDVVVETAAGWKFESRTLVYDSEMIPNSIIYPL
jgi:salicylate 5-hydroxylase small subunit